MQEAVAIDGENGENGGGGKWQGDGDGGGEGEEAYSADKDPELLAELESWKRGLLEEKKASTEPWLEKHRPQDFGGIVHHTEVISTLKKTLSSGSLPNLLFHGPPGTGKTTTILALAKQLYPEHTWRHNVLELNASTERGIDIIREKVKTFAKFAPHKSAAAARSNKSKSASGAAGASGASGASGVGVPSFKLVILDEADSMTHDAQSALKRMMETQVGVTRFVIICNYVTRIIDPIVSRTVRFRFHALPASAIKPRLCQIRDSERISISDLALDFISDAASGDMRAAITLLHSATVQHRNLASTHEKEQISVRHVRDVASIDEKEQISVDHVRDVAGLVPAQLVADTLSGLCAARDDFAATRQLAKEIIWSGHPVLSFLELLTEKLVTHTEKLVVIQTAADSFTAAAAAGADQVQTLAATACAKACLEIAAAEERLLLGGDEELQLTALFSTLATLLSSTVTVTIVDQKTRRLVETT